MTQHHLPGIDAQIFDVSLRTVNLHIGVVILVMCAVPKVIINRTERIVACEIAHILNAISACLAGEVGSDLQQGEVSDWPD